MNLLSGRKPLFAGLALILMTNAAALLAVAYNRSGTPESTLTLTQRELAPPSWRGPAAKDNSGLELALRWRVLNEEAGETFVYDYGGNGGTPRWLDRAKLAELGVDVAAAEARDRADFGGLPSREVLLVLEQDGPTWRRALERARQRLQAEQAKAAAAPADKAAEGRLKFIGEALQHEEHDNSRLFAVDAGLDLAGLRARYPERNRYAIVRGRVQPMFVGRAREGRLGGRVAALAVDRINMPLEFSVPLQPARHRPPGQGGAGPAFAAGIAFGQRLEPWITALRAATDAPAPSAE